MTERVFHKKVTVVSVKPMYHKYYWLCRSEFREKLEWNVTVKFFSVVHVCGFAGIISAATECSAVS